MARQTVLGTGPAKHGQAGQPMSMPSTFFRVLLPFASGYYLAYLFRTVGALVSERMAADIHLLPADLGMLNAAFFLAFALALVPVGIALDRYGPRRVQAVLLPVAAIGAGVFALASSIPMLVAGRALIGLGCAGGLMAGLKAVSLWFPPERLALANGALITLGAFGAVTATAPAELFLNEAGWRELFGLLAVLAACSAALVAGAVPPRPGPVAAVPAEEAAGVLDVYRSRQFWRLAPLSTCCVGTSFAMQGLWAAPWLRDVAGLARADVIGVLFAMAMALAAGAFGLGVVATGLRRTRVSAADALAGVAALSAAAQLAMVLEAPVAPLWPWLMVALAGSASVLSYSALAAIFPKQIAGRANCALNTLHMTAAFAIQSGIGVLLGLWGADAVGHTDALAYRAAFAVVLVPQCIALVWFVVGGARQKQGEGLCPSTPAKAGPLQSFT